MEPLNLCHEKTVIKNALCILRVTAVQSWFADTNEIIQEPFDSCLNKYQINLEQSMMGNNFIFDVSGAHYICIKVSLRFGGSYIDSSKWIKSKKTIINPKTNNDNCFQNEQVKEDQLRIRKIYAFINQNEWKNKVFLTCQSLSLFCLFHTLNWNWIIHWTHKMVTTTVRTASIQSEQKVNLNHVKMCAKILIIVTCNIVSTRDSVRT